MVHDTYHDLSTFHNTRNWMGQGVINKSKVKAKSQPLATRAVKSVRETGQWPHKNPLLGRRVIILIRYSNGIAVLCRITINYSDFLLFKGHALSNYSRALSPPQLHSLSHQFIHASTRPISSSPPPFSFPHQHYRFLLSLTHYRREREREFC